MQWSTCTLWPQWSILALSSLAVRKWHSLRFPIKSDWVTKGCRASKLPILGHAMLSKVNILWQHTFIFQVALLGRPHLICQRWHSMMCQWTSDSTKPHMNFSVNTACGQKKGSSGHLQIQAWGHWGQAQIQSSHQCFMVYSMCLSQTVRFRCRKLYFCAWSQWSQAGTQYKTILICFMLELNFLSAAIEILL